MNKIVKTVIVIEQRHVIQADQWRWRTRSLYIIKSLLKITPDGRRQEFVLIDGRHRHDYNRNCARFVSALNHAQERSLLGTIKSVSALALASKGKHAPLHMGWSPVANFLLFHGSLGITQCRRVSSVCPNRILKQDLKFSPYSNHDTIGSAGGGKKYADESHRILIEDSLGERPVRAMLPQVLNRSRQGYDFSAKIAKEVFVQVEG